MPCLFKGRAAMPLCLDMEKSLGTTMSLDINGTVGESGFSVSVSSKLDLTDEVCFSFNPRPADNLIAMNTMTNGKWLKEEHLKWLDIFNPKKTFKIRIEATGKSYEVFDLSGPSPRNIASYAYRSGVNEKACIYLVCQGTGTTITSVCMNS